jgi:phospholipase C
MATACRATPAASPSVTSTTAAPITTLLSGPCGPAPAPPATYDHVIWIWMENHSWPQVLGEAKAAPCEVKLAAQCATATLYRSVASPSLPNYIAATSGATQGIGDDAAPPSHRLTADNLFRQVRAAGGVARSYQEDMATPCQQTSSDRYAVKHNPAAYYVGAGGEDRAACQADDLSLAAFTSALTAGSLPAFAFVTPNLCNDTHDCSVATGDAWLAANVAPVLASATYRAGKTAVFVVWDEPTPVANVVISPSIHPGTTVAQPVDHYALLRATEEMLGLPGRLGAAAGAADLRDLFKL